MFPLRLCGGKPLVAVTRERRYGPSRLRVNDDDDDDDAASVLEEEEGMSCIAVQRRRGAADFVQEACQIISVSRARAVHCSAV